MSTPTGLNLDKFLALRPSLYHLTAITNLPRIHRLGMLQPAADLCQEANRGDLLRKRRPAAERIACNGDTVSIRDQEPLHAGNCALAPGFSFEDLVALLNAHVFFWPGTPDAPIPHGRRHFARYAVREDCVVLQIPTADLLAANPDVAPLFCSFNSGSPRCVPIGGVGRKAPRGPDLFLPADSFAGPPGRVVELTFRSPVRLPLDRTTIRPASAFLA